MTSVHPRAARSLDGALPGRRTGWQRWCVTEASQTVLERRAGDRRNDAVSYALATRMQYRPVASLSSRVTHAGRMGAQARRDRPKVGRAPVEG